MLNNIELHEYLEKFFEKKKLKVNIRQNEKCEVIVKFAKRTCIIHFNYFGETYDSPKVDYILTYNYGSIFRNKDYTNPNDLAKDILNWFTGKMGIPIAYLANIYKGKKNYSGHFIDFDGCAFADKDFYKCIKRAKGSLVLHLEGLLEDGEPLPPATHDWRINGRDMDEENYLILIETELKIGR